MKHIPVVFFLLISAAAAQTPIARTLMNPATRDAIDRWLAGIRGSEAGQVVAVDEDAVGRSFPSLSFFVLQFRQHPVAPAVSEGLRANNLLVVRPDGTVEALSDIGDLQALFRSGLAPVKTKDQAEIAVKAWLRLTQEFHQDGFFLFAAPADLRYSSERAGIVASGKTALLPDAGDQGEIRVVLSFDRAGTLLTASETVSVIAGPQAHLIACEFDTPQNRPLTNWRRYPTPRSNLSPAAPIPVGQPQRTRYHRRLLVSSVGSSIVPK